MTSEFKSGKTYLIEGKGIEQVKNEIKEWFNKYEFEILEEGENEIEGHKKNTWIKFDVWLYIKFKLMKDGTLLVFHNKNIKCYEVMVVIYPDLRRYAGEWQKNLVRFLSGRKELGLEYYAKYFHIIVFIPSFIVFILLYTPLGQLPDKYNATPIFIFTALSLLILRYLVSIYKLGQVNLPEYKVEEYTGKIDIE